MRNNWLKLDALLQQFPVLHNDFEGKGKHLGVTNPLSLFSGFLNSIGAKFLGNAFSGSKFFMKSTIIAIYFIL